MRHKGQQNEGTAEAVPRAQAAQPVHTAAAEPLGKDATDRELVIAFQSGDDRAYDELYRRHIARVRNVCRRLLDDHQDAEEAAQETFLRSFQALGRFNGQYQVGAWLTRIASNVCFDLLRSKQRHFVVVDLAENDVEELEGGAGPDATVPDKIELTSTLRSIRPLHARALMLRTVEGLSHQEMAGELEITPDQVKALLHRARTSFRRAWQDASGWSLAPLAGLRSLITQRPREAAAAGDGAAAGFMSPMGQVVLEKLAASAVAAALAFSGVPAGPGSTNEEAPRAHSVAERAGGMDIGAPATRSTGAAPREQEANGESKVGRLARVLLSAPKAVGKTLDDDPEGDDPPDDRGSNEPTTVPTVTTKPVSDTAKEARDRIDEQTDRLP